jgi:hypothetical protein
MRRGINLNQSWPPSGSSALLRFSGRGTLFTGMKESERIEIQAQRTTYILIFEGYFNRRPDTQLVRYPHDKAIHHINVFDEARQTRVLGSDTVGYE